MFTLFKKKSIVGQRKCMNCQWFPGMVVAIIMERERKQHLQILSAGFSWCTGFFIWLVPHFPRRCLCHRTRRTGARRTIVMKPSYQVSLVFLTVFIAQSWGFATSGKVRVDISSYSIVYGILNQLQIKSMNKTNL